MQFDNLIWRDLLMECIEYSHNNCYATLKYRNELYKVSSKLVKSCKFYCQVIE